MITVTLQAYRESTLERRIERYLESYHPAGYGTWVKRRYKEGRLFKADITRGTTAD